MSQQARPPAGSAVGGHYEFRIAGPVGPLTRAALPAFDTVVIPRFTVLTGRCGGLDELHRLLTALEAQGSPATAARVTTPDQPSDPG